MNNELFKLRERETEFIKTEKIKLKSIPMEQKVYIYRTTGSTLCGYLGEMMDNSFLILVNDEPHPILFCDYKSHHIVPEINLDESLGYISLSNAKNLLGLEDLGAISG